MDSDYNQGFEVTLTRFHRVPDGLNEVSGETLVRHVTFTFLL
jgi:hypothetical protein